MRKQNETLFSIHNERKENATGSNWYELLFHWSESNGSFSIPIFLLKLTMNSYLINT